MKDSLCWWLILTLLPGAWADPGRTPLEGGGGTASAAAEVYELPRVAVTGSRLQTVELPRLLPVQEFTAERISALGYGSTGDFLRSLPLNLGYRPGTQYPVNLNGGQQGVNFRGLGPNSTLILVNGRRLPVFAQADATVLSYDVGSLPTAAVEAVEILPEGASAVYGADAVAGVVNVRLRRSFEGTWLRTGYEQFEDSDLSRWTAAAVAGGKVGRTQWLAVMDYATQNDVRLSDRERSRGEDQRPHGGYDYRQNFGFPGQLTLPSTAAVPADLLGGSITIGARNPDGTVTQGDPTAHPEIGDFVKLPLSVTNGAPTAGDSVNNFDRSFWTTLLPAEEQVGGFASLEHALRETLQVRVEGGWRHTVLRSTIHPTPAGTQLESGQGDGPGGAIIFPATNPYNPFGVDIANLRFQVVELGPRVRQYTIDNPYVLAGARGEVGSWKWESAVSHSENRVQEDTENYLTDVGLQDGLAGRAGGYLNPFGPSDPGVIDRLRTGLHANHRYRLTQADARAAGPLAEWKVGSLEAAVGVEWREEAYRSQPEGLAATGGYAAWSKLTAFRAGRRVSAAFAEAQIPLLPHLTSLVAIRAEEYSDFGTSAKPRLILSWDPASWVGLRLSYGEAFKAPELLDLYADQIEIYGTIRDPLRPDLGPYSVRQRTGGNPDLQPEETEAWSANLTVRPDFLDGLRLGATAWRYDKEGTIGTLGMDYILQHELDAAHSTAARITRGTSTSPGLPGEIVQIVDTRHNLGGMRIDGLDLDASQRWVLDPGKALQTGVQASWLHRYSVRSATGNRSDLAGWPGYPKWRGTAYVEWSNPGWSTTWSARYEGPARTGSTSPYAQPEIEDALFFNWTVRVELPWDLTATLAITNLFDTHPPANNGTARGYDGHYDNRPRAYAVGLERRF